MQNQDLSFFEGMGLEQLQLLEALLDQAILEEGAQAEARQIREIVPIYSWLNSSYYVGSWAKDLYPYWKKKITEHAESGSPNLIITGSIGTGKSSAALLYALRKLYELSCYDSPQRLFGLSDRSHIFFAYLSLSYRHAKLSGFGQLRDMVDGIPYFQKEYPRDKNIDSILNFPNLVSIIPGSDNLSIISLNIFGCIQDEADFYRKGTSSKFGDIHKAQAIFADVADRRASRFMSHGYDPGFATIISSATYESSFVSSRRKNAHKTGDTVIVSRLYEVKANKYSKEKFCVFRGTEMYEAFIVQELEEIIEIAAEPLRIKMRKRALGLKAKGVALFKYILEFMPQQFQNNFVFIPVDFKKNFETDIYRALNNIAGENVLKTGKLFTSGLIWRTNIDPNLKHPFTREVIELSVTGTDDILNFFKPKVLFHELHDGDGIFNKWKLRRHPGALRFVHIDQSTSHDSTGLTISHVSEMVEDESTLLRVPKVEIDLMLIIKPIKQGKKVSIAKQISIAKVRKFIFILEAMGMPIGKVSYDQYASADSLQIFVRKGIPAERQSVDRDDSQYLQFVDMLTETRINMYRYLAFEKEFFNLEHDVTARKVDHPVTNEDGTEGTKDISDSAVASVNLALTDERINRLTPEQILEGLGLLTHDKVKKVDKYVSLFTSGYDKVQSGQKITGFIGG